MDDIHCPRERQARYSPHEKRRGERTADTAGPESGRGGDHLQVQHDYQDHDRHPGIIRETDRPTEPRDRHVIFGQQAVDRRIPVAVQRGHQIDQASQPQSTHQQSDVSIAEVLFEEFSDPGIDPGKMDRCHRHEKGQQYVIENTLQVKGRVLRKIERQGLPHEKIGDQDTCSRRQDKGDKRSHRQVEGEHFDHENDPRHRNFKYGCQRRRRTATQQQGTRLGVQVEHPGKIGPDRRPRPHGRPFESHGAAEPYGKGRGDERRIGGTERQDGFLP